VVLLVGFHLSNLRKGRLRAHNSTVDPPGSKLEVFED